MIELLDIEADDYPMTPYKVRASGTEETQLLQLSKNSTNSECFVFPLGFGHFRVAEDVAENFGVASELPS